MYHNLPEVQGLQIPQQYRTNPSDIPTKHQVRQPKINNTNLPIFTLHILTK